LIKFTGDNRYKRTTLIKFKPRWLLGIMGILFIMVGIFNFVYPLYSYEKMVRYSGAILILTGVVLQIACSSSHISFRLERRTMLVESIADFLFGILLIFNPFLSFIAYSLIIGSWILTIGTLKIFVSLLTLGRVTGWIYVLIFGIISCVFALLIIYAPLQKSNEISKLLGGFFITMGAILVYDSVRLKRKHEAVGLLF
jgi:uncharacterized membrane protein HdeD (DUF308 family)